LGRLGSGCGLVPLFVGRLGLGPHVVGRLLSEPRVVGRLVKSMGNASFQKISRPVSWLALKLGLRSGPMSWVGYGQEYGLVPVFVRFNNREGMS